MCISGQCCSFVLFCLSAQFVPQTERGDWEDCHHPCQRKRRENQGPGELRLLIEWTSASRACQVTSGQPLMFFFFICGENTVRAAIYNSYEAPLHFCIEMSRSAKLSYKWVMGNGKRCNIRWSWQLIHEHLPFAVIMQRLALSGSASADPQAAT